MLDPVREIVGDLSPVTLLATLGRDQDKTGSTSGSVDRGGGGILQDIDALNVVRIDVNILRGRIAVDNVQRFGAGGQRVNSTHTDLHTLSRSAACLMDFHAGYLSDNRLPHSRRCKRQFPCLNLSDGTCEVAFTHRGVADNHRFLKRLHIVTKDNIQCLPVGRHTDTHIREAKTQKHQLRLSVRDLDAVLSVQIG